MTRKTGYFNKSFYILVVILFLLIISGYGHQEKRIIPSITKSKEALGYKNIYKYKGGWEAWIEKNYPVEK
jgi:hypothetical protein